MSDRVILQFGNDDESEYSCGENDCANRWRCMLHTTHVMVGTDKSFKPGAELVVVEGRGTLTCHDYWQGKGEGDGRTTGR